MSGTAGTVSAEQIVEQAISGDDRSRSTMQRYIDYFTRAMADTHPMIKHIA